jgi:TPP-dependent indolepyruvate ferredoxin oxidoreductase alpha subunit
MVRLRSFTNQLDGEIALGRLEALGVKAMLETDNCGGMRPHLDLQAGVHLIVIEAEAEKAREILAESGEAPKGPPWLCSGCGEESENGFDTCWKCGRARD